MTRLLADNNGIEARRVLNSIAQSSEPKQEHWSNLHLTRLQGAMSWLIVDGNPTPSERWTPPRGGVRNVAI
jgi:hypothetical protein